jgi:cytochrome b6-f complex iron-sulfur subunit
MSAPEKPEASPGDRRSFLSTLFTGSLTVGLIGLLATVVAYIFPPERRGFESAKRRLRVARVEEIPVGKGKQLVFKGDPVWVLHLRSGFVALSALCTHQGCIVHWDEKRLTFTCPCHAGLFDAGGHVLAGPPQRPLRRLRVEELSGEIYLGAEEGES